MKRIEVNASSLDTLGLALLFVFAVVFLIRDVSRLLVMNPEPAHFLGSLRWLALPMFAFGAWIAATFLRQSGSRALKFAVVFFLVGFGLRLLLSFDLLPSGLQKLAAMTHLVTGIAAILFLLAFLGSWFREKVRIV